MEVTPNHALEKGVSLKQAIVITLVVAIIVQSWVSRLVICFSGALCRKKKMMLK